MSTKTLKRITLWCLLVAVVVCAVCGAFGLNYKYNTIYHTVSQEPSGLNVTFYNGQLSRGFSWWTEDGDGFETKLYLSETPFKDEDLSKAKLSKSNIGGDHIEGIYLIEGKTCAIPDNTRWGRIFSIEYLNHTVFAEGLILDQQYYYAVGGNGEFSFGEFETENDLKTVVVNFSDFQTNDGTKLSWGSKTLNAAIGASNLNIDFFAFGGDFTSTFTIGKQSFNHYLGWIKSRDSIARQINSTPLVMAPGNHDATDDLFTSNNALLYQGVSDNGGYYSFDYNNLHFVVLNSNQFDKQQQSWLEADLKKANSDKKTEWTVIMTHKGPYTTGDHGLDMEKEFVEKLSKLCSEYRVDLVLQAHDHTYSKTLPYLWGGKGVMTSENDPSVINASVNTVTKKGIEYDFNPNGTYYVSCGASGHRIGENAEYAISTGEKSFTHREYKVAAATIEVDSVYADIGDVASIDLGRNMFGILEIDGGSLIYSFYAVDDNGKAVLFDRLAILKENADAKTQ